MWLIAGLGNPGEEYAHTRHNAGFETVDELARLWGVSYWKTQCGSLVGQVTVRLESGEVEPVILAKPQSFMNKSGGPVALLCREYKVSPNRLVVIHDELDINPGTIRVKNGGGHAGHNGLKSIIEKLGTKSFMRVRVGIGRPPGRMSVVTFVLQVPRGESAELFESAYIRASEAVVHLINHGLVVTQNEFN